MNRIDRALAVAVVAVSTGFAAPGPEVSGFQRRFKEDLLQVQKSILPLIEPGFPEGLTDLPKGTMDFPKGTTNLPKGHLPGGHLPDGKNRQISQ